MKLKAEKFSAVSTQKKNWFCLSCHLSSLTSILSPFTWPSPCEACGRGHGLELVQKGNALD